MRFHTKRGRSTPPLRALLRAVLEAAEGGSRESFDRLDDATRERVIDLLESLGYIEMRQESGGEPGSHASGAIVITPLGRLKLQDLRQTSDDEK